MNRDELFKEISENANAIVRVGKNQYAIVCSSIKINGVSICEPSRVHFLDTFVSIDNTHIDYEIIKTLWVGSKMEWDDNGPIGK